MKIKFSKMHGIGNDFIIINDIESRISKKTPYPILAQKLCDRHLGIGADGLIIAQKSSYCDIKFIIFNADGSEAEMCGNGMRCFAKYLYDNKIISKQTITVETLAGKIIPQILLNKNNKVENIQVNMGIPILEPSKIVFNTNKKIAISEKISTSEGDIEITAVSMGNPHAVIFCDKHNDEIIKKLGPIIEKHNSFPNKTNVEFVQVISESEINIRVWERGVGETLACGTGACAALVAAHLNGKTDRKASVKLLGGSLIIEWNKNDKHIYKTGPAVLVFNGTVDI